MAANAAGAPSCRSPTSCCSTSPKRISTRPRADELYQMLTQENRRRAVVVVSHDEHKFPNVAGRRIWHVEEQKVIERAEW